MNQVGCYELEWRRTCSTDYKSYKVRLIPSSSSLDVYQAAYHSPSTCISCYPTPLKMSNIDTHWQRIAKYSPTSQRREIERGGGEGGEISKSSSLIATTWHSTLPDSDDITANGIHLTRFIYLGPSSKWDSLHIKRRRAFNITAPTAQPTVMNSNRLLPNPHL